MNHISVIQWVCGALAVIATLVGLGFFTRACLTIANRFRLGAPVDRQRLHPVGKRLKTLLVKVLCHQDFKGRPWIRIAHWLVMCPSRSCSLRWSPAMRRFLAPTGHCR